jgi:hypothetical protein
MSSLIKSLLPILLSAISLWTCNCQDEATAYPDCFEVSYVTGICGEAVLKIQDPALYHLGESWSGHENVFFCMLPCGVDTQSLSNKTFRVAFGNPDHNCAVCLATIGYTGSKRYNIVITDTCAPPRNDGEN